METFNYKIFMNVSQNNIPLAMTVWTHEGGFLLVLFHCAPSVCVHTNTNHSNALIKYPHYQEQVKRFLTLDCCYILRYHQKEWAKETIETKVLDFLKKINLCQQLSKWLYASKWSDNSGRSRYVACAPSYAQKYLRPKGPKYLGGVMVVLI